MSEGNVFGQRDSSELADLVRELEAQIDSVNAGLSKIRGTVARISYAALGSTTPAPAALWAAEVPAGPEASAPVEVAPPPESPSPTFDADITPPALHHESEAPGIWDAVTESEPSGFWASIAEGASWPRAHGPDTPSTEPATPTAGAWNWPVTPPAEPVAEPETAVVKNEEPAVSPVMPEVSQSQWDTGIAGTTPSESPALSQPPAAPSYSAPSSSLDKWGFGAHSEGSWGFGGPANKQEPDVDVKKEGMPSSLATGWPDESAWSQSFEWQAMKSDAPAQPESGAPPVDDTRAAVSDIVAQMKAEIAAARAEGIELSAAPPLEVQELSFDEETAVEGTGEDSEPVVAAAEQPSEPVAAAEEAEMHEEARREEVSRAVAEIRQQIASGDFANVMHENGYATAEEIAGAVPADPRSEEDVREDVRRAVEAAREEMAAGREEAPSKPAFRLAAPGSLPDWSHMQMEPSGPPMVVMKDADGRVELASVYETLNELGCGDGAALLNYTPHSVTIGLPISAKVPSKEEMAEAVEKVFGLVSRVESDGVRLTVSIGVDPKRRSVDAA